MDMEREFYKFWMVWREGGSSPTYRHQTKEAATAEAERLAKSNPDQVFYVLKATGAVLARSNVEHLKLTFDPIPF